MADFQDFIRTASESDAFDRIVIAIDELDKLASTDDLIAVVNEIKDILHIEGTHVIVSVSHDALYRFLLRGLPVRDVFDSAFDEIIQVSLLDSAESVEILKKRAVGFPASWALTCYMLSGGLPRDLLRYGRRCVAIYLERNEGIAAVVPQLIGEMAAERVGAELDAQGVISRLTAHGRRESESAIQAARGGSVAVLVRLVDALNDEALSKIRAWLCWLMDVMDAVNSNSFSESDEKFESLAKRGMLAYSGKLLW